MELPAGHRWVSSQGVLMPLASSAVSAKVPSKSNATARTSSDLLTQPVQILWRRKRRCSGTPPGRAPQKGRGQVSGRWVSREPVRVQERLVTGPFAGIGAGRLDCCKQAALQQSEPGSVQRAGRDAALRDHNQFREASL